MSVCRILFKNHFNTIKLRCCFSNMQTDAYYEERRNKFAETFPKFVDSVAQKFKGIEGMDDWMKKVLQYNLSDGKKLRGLTTVYAYETFEKPENITEESLQRAYILGHCTEVVHKLLLILDDIMDGSYTRNGKPCWYRLPEVGMQAIGDTILLQTSVFQELKSHFGHHPNYVNIVFAFIKTLQDASTGQYLDMEGSYKAKKLKDFSVFNMNYYITTAQHKTGHTYKLPTTLALLLCSNTNEMLTNLTEDISMDLTLLFQSKDDCIDCFVDESVSGKIGTDIEEGKCTWLAVQALQRCNASQLIVFKTCYGSNEPAHTERIKHLYQQLNLPQIYEEYAEDIRKKIERKIQLLPTERSVKLFQKLLNEAIQRKK